MPKYQPVDRKHHADKRWRRISTYNFAAQDAVVTLVAQELPKAQVSLPIAFIKVGETFTPIAVLGFKAGQNLVVAADGRWRGGYVPAAYRGYPFRLANTDDGRKVLCVDGDSGLVTDGPEGEPFFNDDGTPAKPVADLLNFFGQLEANRKLTARICAALQQHDLIQPWPIKVRIEKDKQKQTCNGLFRIAEAKLNVLSPDAFIELRDLGALTVAYCQLLSMQHLPELEKLAQAVSRAERTAEGRHLKTAPSGELDLEFLNKGGSINFGNLV